MRLFRCDQCGKVEDARVMAGDNGVAILSHPEDWLQLSRYGIDADTERSFEFCAVVCLIRWLEQRDR